MQKKISLIIFILILEEEKFSTRIIYKSYDMITLNLMLIKIASDVFIDNE